MYPSKKLAVVLLLEEQNAEVHTILPAKHSVIGKVTYMQSLRDVPLFSFDHGGARITVGSAFGCLLSSTLC